MPTTEFTTNIGCSLKCSLCPQSSLLTNYKSPIKILSFENFKFLLNKIPNYVRIDFSGMSEPWLNKECNQMFLHTLNSGYKTAVYTTLVGLTKQTTDDFFEIINDYYNLITRFCIHLPDKNNNMTGWKFSENYEYSLTKMLSLEDIVKKQINFQLMTMDSKSQVHNSLLKIVYLDNHWKGHTRAGSLNISEENKSYIDLSPKHNTPVMCKSTPFYDHNTILPNGDVLLCCMDYGMKHVLGNLFVQNYDDLYLSPELVKVMKENKKEGFSENVICKSCCNVNKCSIEDNHWKII